MEQFLPEIEQIIFKSRHLEEVGQTDQKLAAAQVVKFLKEKGFGEVVYLKEE